METCKKTAFVLLICCIVAGCGDSYSASNSRRLHYSDLIYQRGEPTEIVSDGAGGKIFSYSPLPIDEALQLPSYRVERSDIYYVDRQGYVYP